MVPHSNPYYFFVNTFRCDLSLLDQTYSISNTIVRTPVINKMLDQLYDWYFGTGILGRPEIKRLILVISINIMFIISLNESKSGI